MSGHQLTYTVTADGASAVCECGEFHAWVGNSDAPDAVTPEQVLAGIHAFHVAHPELGVAHPELGRDR